MKKKKKKKAWGCAYCNCANKASADYCKNCRKKKKEGSPFSLHF